MALVDATRRLRRPYADPPPVGRSDLRRDLPRQARLPSAPRDAPRRLARPEPLGQALLETPRVEFAQQAGGIGAAEGRGLLERRDRARQISQQTARRAERPQLLLYRIGHGFDALDPPARHLQDRRPECRVFAHAREGGILQQRGEGARAALEGRLQSLAGSGAVPALCGLARPQQLAVQALGIDASGLEGDGARVRPEPSAGVALQREGEAERGGEAECGDPESARGRAPRQPTLEGRDAAQREARRDAEQAGQDRVEVAVGERELEGEYLRDGREGREGQGPMDGLGVAAAQHDHEAREREQADAGAGKPPGVEGRERGWRLLECRGAVAAGRHGEVAHRECDAAAGVGPEIRVRIVDGYGACDGRCDGHRDYRQQPQPEAERAEFAQRHPLALGVAAPELGREDGQGEGGADLGQQPEPEEEAREPRAALGADEREQAAEQCEKALDLEDPRDRLDVGRMQEEEAHSSEGGGRRQARAHARIAVEGEERCAGREVQRETRQVVAAGRLAEELPLQRVEHEVHRRIVERQHRGAARRKPDRAQIFEAQGLDVGVAGDIEDVVRDERPRARGRVDHEEREAGQEQQQAEGGGCEVGSRERRGVPCHRWPVRLPRHLLRQPCASTRKRCAGLRAARPWRGGAGGNRTRDLLNAIQALSQLSYGPTRTAEANPSDPAVKGLAALRSRHARGIFASARRSGEIGIRRGLKIPRSHGLAGSSPASGTRAPAVRADGRAEDRGMSKAGGSQGVARLNVHRVRTSKQKGTSLSFGPAVSPATDQGDRKS